MSHDHYRWGRAGPLGVAVALFAVTLLAAACSGGGRSDPTTTTAAGGDPQAAMLKFSRCLREHGVNMPDQGAVSRRGERGASDDPAKDPDYPAAERACRSLLAGVAIEQGSGGTQLPKQDLDAMLRYARCMREHGVDMPDPSPNGGLVGQAGGAGPDPDSPAYKAADQQCRQHLRSLQANGATRADGGGDRP